MFTRETLADKVNAMTSDDIARIAEERGLAYDVVEKQLNAIRKQSEYYQRPEVKARTKKYRDQARDLKNAIKSSIR